MYMTLLRVNRGMLIYAQSGKKDDEQQMLQIQNSEDKVIQIAAFQDLCSDVVPQLKGLAECVSKCIQK